MQKFNNKLLLIAAVLTTAFSSNAAGDCIEPDVVYMDTIICPHEILFGEKFDTAGMFQVTRPGFSETGCPTDTIWNISVPELIVKIRAQDFSHDDKTETQINVSIMETGFGRTPILDYHWEPELSSEDLLKPVVSPTETTTYTLYVNASTVGGMSNEENGCHIHVKESITINVDSAVDDILANPSSKGNKYYDLNGHKVDSPERRKVYINNGKKIMYK